jgi:zinc transport system substrate-binding protein
MPVTPAELKDLADKKPGVIFENVHMGGGQPIIEASGAKKIELVNFPGDNLELLDVFKTNATRIEEVLGQ